MLIILSHALAFSVLFIASVFDLETSEVPDFLGIIGVAGGIFLHALYSFREGYMDLEVFSGVDPVTLVQMPYSFPLMVFQYSPVEWFQMLGEPLVYSLMAGLVFSVYGWGLYYFGMWGGADAIAMGVLGFASPFAVGGMGLAHSVNLVVNIMLVGFVYTLAYGFYVAFRREGFIGELVSYFESMDKRIGLQVLLAAVASALVGVTKPLTGIGFFVVLAGLVLLYHVLKVVEDHAFTVEKDVEELEGGEVPAPDQGLGDKVRGITEEEIESIEKDSIVVKSGVRFIPVFPVALVMTSLSLGGIEIFLLFSVL